MDAILFPVNATQPRLIRVPWTYGPTSDNIPLDWQKLDCQPWIGGKDSALKTMYVQTLGRNGPALGYTIAIEHDDNSFVNGSVTNRCIPAVTGGRAPHPWAGNVIALRAKEAPSDWFESAVMEKDLAPVIQFFKDYGRM